MEQVCNPKNLLRAYRRVRSNNGKPGVDGMTVHDLADWLRENIAALTAALLDGTYRPRPVRGVSIPKPGGGQRQLGIPVVVDRLVQQAILLRPHLFQLQLWIPARPSAHMALEQARKYVAQGGASLSWSSTSKSFSTG
jgi:RNA-directed DNA polymerase